uniref:Uncharacterized protein n=1 Tax=Lactuca sativa TaxID=4236 RepID=A0A9R1WGH5_LACSA|nr:hypothetical protein LSAT_V11C100000130 [Lactuca sativa]
MESTPKTDKTSDDGENEKLRYEVSSMQGWRTSMEDVSAQTLITIVINQDFMCQYEVFGSMLLYLTWTTPHLSLEFMMAMEAVSKFCAKYLHLQVLKQEAYAAGDIGTAAQKSFLRMDEMMCGQRGWRELAILGNKMDQFSGMIEGLIWSPKGNDLKGLNDNWSTEEVSSQFLVCNINNNNFFSWAKEILTHAKEYKMMTCLPSLSQKEILVNLFQSIGTYNTYPGWIPSTYGAIS